MSCLVLDKVRRFIAENFPSAGPVGDDSSLVEGGVVDSMGVVEIISFLESDFGIIVEDEEVAIENFDSIDRIVAFVKRKI